MNNRKSSLLTIFAMFVLFLTWYIIVDNLKMGVFLKVELILLAIFLLAAIKLTAGILSDENKWGSLIVFYSLSFVNLLAIYFVTLSVKVISLPFIATGIGYLIALMKIDDEDLEENNEKYVSSKTGKKYHVPECAQAKRIKNKVEYNSEEEAEKGKTACKCVNS